MLKRYIKSLFARFFIALLFVQLSVTAYACPIFAATTSVASYGHESAKDSHGAMSKRCEEQLADIGNSKVCHQHYVGDLSSGAPNVGFGPSAPAVAVMGLSRVKSVFTASVSATPVSLQRAIGPALSIRFQVLRI